MGITTRYAQTTDEATALAAAAGAQGEQGEKGDKGDPGTAVELPVKYITADGTPATVPLSGTQSRRFRVLLTDDVTFKFAGFNDGAKFSVTIRQDGTGGHTVTWPAGIDWPGGTPPTVTGTPNKHDTYGFERYKNASRDGYDGFVIGQNI